MLPFVRMFNYGNIVPGPEPGENLTEGILQQQYHNTMYLHEPTHTLYAYGINTYKVLGYEGLSDKFKVSSTNCKKYWLGVFGSLMINTTGSILYCGDATAFPQSGGSVSWLDVTSVFTGLGVKADDIKSVYIGLTTRILLNDGRVLCCGSNSDGESGLGSVRIC